ncbi:hypothetical protein RQP46_000480 [Phenoliferia psychrophenolica]
MAPPVTGQSNLLESFVTVGTPLPSLDKADKGEFKPIWEQEVTDERGRRRFHGAFTGGFTAGFHGTAGSKEGWAPSTFKSSRSNRANDKSKNTAQMAEEFMDEEDLAELAASRTISTAAAYAPPPSSSYDPLLGVFGPQPGAGPSNEPATAALASLIEPASTRIGAQLMRKMGWREGQGVGPRITFDQRKKQAMELGLKLAQEEDDDEGEGEASRHYYAPLDRPLATVLEVGIATDRGWGLGYKAAPGIPSSSSTEQTTRGAARTTMEDEDDDDVYGGSGAPSQGKGGWGVIDVEMDDGITLLDPTRPHQRQSKKQPPKKPERTREVFFDGTSLLSGFSLMHEKLPGSSMSPLPPAPPRSWVPNPQRLWDEASSSTQDKGKGKQLDATERGTLLGEKPPEPVPKSVFDYLSARDKARIASLTHQPTASTSSAPDAAAAPAEPDGPLIVPQMDPVTALAALKGFQPFSANSTSPDPARQARYTLYLQLQARLLPPSDATLPFGPRKLPTGKTQTITELNRELDDYARAARVFKPVSGMLAGRFTSGGAGGTGPKVEPGLYQPPPKSDVLASTFTSADATPVVEAPPERLTPAQTAARAGMFGPLTRTVESFRPEKLVCKRFGVVDPWAGDNGDGGDEVGGAWKEASRTGFGRPGDRAGVGEVLGKSSMDALMQSAGYKKYQPPEEEHVEVHVPMMAGDSAASATARGGAKDGPKAVDAPTLENVGLGDDEKQGAETLTYTKAPKDIFAAIFADSDDEDDEDDDDDDEGADAPMMVEPPSMAPPAKSEPSAPEPAPAPALEPEPEPESTTDDVVLTTSTLSSYRPSFTGAKSSKPSEDDSVKKKKKKSKPTKVALSFDVDDGEAPAPSVPKATKKRRREDDGKKPKLSVAESVDAEAEMEWVEVPQRASESAAPVPASTSKGPGRAKASDLY